MGRLLYCILALAACARPKAPAAPVAEQPVVEVPSEAPAPVPVPAADPATPATPAPTPEPEPRTSNPVQPADGDAAHCLYVEPNHRVVRCFWKREDCVAQIQFNTDSGVTGAQSCKGVKEVHCMKARASTEQCYPTADECGQMFTNMQQRNRQPTTCTVKTGP